MTTQNPFQIPLRQRFLARTLENLLGLSPLADCYANRPTSTTPSEFLAYTLKTLGVEIKLEQQEEALQRVPRSGPLVIVANHPLGGLEGIALAHLLMQVRPDLQVMVNELLCQIPELKDIFIGVDVLSKNAAKQNMRGIRQANQHLKHGGALLIFPAGIVSAINIKRRRIEDHAWNRVAGQLARRHKANCLPIYVHGRNSKLFYIAGLIHPRLRTVMLARELSNKRGRDLLLTIGDPVASSDVAKLKDDHLATHYLRLCTEITGKRLMGRNRAHLPPMPADHLPAADLQKNIEKLQPHLLVSRGEFDVYCAHYRDLGPVMQLIGHAREVTFRMAGEGTGNSIDIDRFDPHYLHLFIWDREKHQVAGAYRVGCVSTILEQQGINGLYSRSLYRYDEHFIKDLGYTMELGRSFIHPDYQRRPIAMDLLWRGIGAFIARNPHYHTLFGAVSVSSEHSSMARALISESMLASFRAEQSVLSKVKPLVPLKVKGKVWTQEMLAAIQNVSLLSKLVGRCDPGKSIPILLRHYLSLNGKFVCFTVNRGFNDSLDGLILVDLRETPVKYLRRYVGDPDYQKVLEVWNQC